MTDFLVSSLGPVAAPPTLLPAVFAALRLAPDRYVVRPSAVGDVLVAWNDDGVAACLVIDGRPIDEVSHDFADRFGRPCEPEPDPATEWLAAIDRSLAGAVDPGLVFDLRSASPFQRAVLDKASEIPAGEVRSYGWVAAEIGRPGAVRAVGTALGRNPVPILIPCHRVVRTDGRIGDYAFGTPAKRAVLTAEGVDPEALERLAAGGIRFVGDATAGTFCHPTCAAVRTLPAGDRLALRTPAAALAAGLRPCARCRPLSGTASAA